MKLQHHIIIIIGIVMAMFFGWQIMNIKKPVPVEQAPLSAYSISIVSATYGMECARFMRGSVGSEESVEIVPNNALSFVAKACDTKPSCTFTVNSEIVGNPDFLSGCGNKNLEVEFRCFSVDKSRKISAYEGAPLVIDCEKIKTK